MDALPPPQQLLVGAAPAPPVQVENTQAELSQADVGAPNEQDMDVSNSARAPTLVQLMQASTLLNAQPVQAPDVEAAWPVAEAANLQPEAAMDEQTAPDVLGHASAQAEKTTEQRLNAVEDKINLLLKIALQLQQKESTPPPPSTPEPAAVPPVHQQPATPTPEAARAQPARPPYPGGKAPRALADIRAFQRAHRDPTFSESKSDGEERNGRDSSELRSVIASNWAQAALAQNQKNATNKRKLQLFAGDSDGDGTASALDSVLETRAKDQSETASEKSASDEDEASAIGKPKDSKVKVIQSKGMYEIYIYFYLKFHHRYIIY